MPLPREKFGGLWQTYPLAGGQPGDTSGHLGKPGHALYPGALAHLDSDLLTSDGSEPKLKTQATLDAEALSSTRAAAKAKAVDAELNLVGLKALVARLTAAGKAASAAVIQADADALEAKLSDALKDLP